VVQGRLIIVNIYQGTQGRSYVSFNFNGHFPGGPGLAGTRMSPF